MVTPYEYEAWNVAGIGDIVVWLTRTELNPNLLAKHLSRGRVVAIRDFYPNQDLLQLVHQLAFPPYLSLPNQARKAKPGDLLKPITEASWPNHVLANFLPDRPLAAQSLQQQVRDYDRYLREFREQVFPGKLLTSYYTWRFAESVEQGLHFDFYMGHTHPQHFNLRMFFNIDDQPRVWNLGPTSFEYGRVMKIYPYKDEDEIQYNLRLSQISEKARPPHQRVEFPPGTLWLAETQMRGHEAFYGRRLAAYTFTIQAASGAAKLLAYTNRFNAWRKTCPVGKEGPLTCSPTPIAK